jgi:hypothetical protein
VDVPVDPVAPAKVDSAHLAVDLAEEPHLCLHK